jgi:hypothetical protein
VLLRPEWRREVQAWLGVVRRTVALQENVPVRGLDDGESAVPIAGLVPGSGAAGDPSIAGPVWVAAVPHEGAEDDVERAAHADASPASKTIAAASSLSAICCDGCSSILQRVEP